MASTSTQSHMSQRKQPCHQFLASDWQLRQKLVMWTTLAMGRLAKRLPQSMFDIGEMERLIKYGAMMQQPPSGTALGVARYLSALIQNVRANHLQAPDPQCPYNGAQQFCIAPLHRDQDRPTRER